MGSGDSSYVMNVQGQKTKYLVVLHRSSDGVSLLVVVVTVDFGVSAI